MFSIAVLKNLFNSEQILVILLTRLHFKTIEKEELIHFLQEHSINYQQLSKLITTHSIRPFIYDVLSTNNIVTDAVFMQQLKDFYLYNQIRSMEQLTIASKVVTELSQRNIKAIPYKGVGLSYNYYNNIGLRESSDIDLLVSQNDGLKTETYLKEQGYIAKTAVPLAYWKYYKRNFKEISYTAPAKQSNYSVEIKWRLLNKHYGKYPAYDFFVKGLKQQHIAGLPFCKLEPVYDFLAISSNHFVKDISIKFKYLVDISCLLSRNPEVLNDELIYNVMDEYKCRKRTEYGLFLIRTLIGIKANTNNTLKYSFANRSVKLALNAQLIKIKVSNKDFISRSLSLQDTKLEKIKFLFRCIANYFLPVASDIGRSNRSIPLLMIKRIFQKLKIAIKRISNKRT